MTVPTGTQQVYATTGNREDLTDEIYDISPTDTPFLSAIESVSAEGVKHEWQTDALSAAVSTNAVIEGDDPTSDTVSATTRLSNYVQLMDKVPQVSSTQRSVRAAGRGDELSYQVAKRSRELKRDLESSLLANNATVVGDASTAREMGGIEAWFTSNVSRDATSGASGSLGTTAATDSSVTRAFAESLLQTVLQSCWDNGGDPDCILVGGFNKQAMSGFTGNATKFQDAQKRSIEAASDLYVSDFGWLEIKPSRFSRSQSALVIETDMFAVAYSQPFGIEPLAKTGHSDRRMLSVEATLEVRNQASSGIIADLTTS